MAADKTKEAPKDAKPRKKSWASGMEQVKLGLMTMDQLKKGVEIGVYSPDPAERDYGPDTSVYQELRTHLDAANAKAKKYAFRIVGSEK